MLKTIWDRMAQTYLGSVEPNKITKKNCSCVWALWNTLFVPLWLLKFGLFVSVTCRWCYPQPQCSVPWEQLFEHTFLSGESWVSKCIWSTTRKSKKAELGQHEQWKLRVSRKLAISIPHQQWVKSCAVCPPHPFCAKVYYEKENYLLGNLGRMRTA